MGRVTSHALVQISYKEFLHLSHSNPVFVPTAIPKYYAVDDYGTVYIYPRIETNKRVFAIVINLEDKDETRR